MMEKKEGGESRRRERGRKREEKRRQIRGGRIGAGRGEKKRVGARRKMKCIMKNMHTSIFIRTSTMNTYTHIKLTRTHTRTHTHIKTDNRCIYNWKLSQAKRQGLK